MINSARLEDSAAAGSLTWYAMQVRVLKEAAVASTLQETLHIKTYLPIVDSKIGAAKRRTVVFPGYLFIYTNLRETNLSSISSVPGAVRLLGSENGPQPIPSTVIDNIRECVATWNTLGGWSMHNFEEGDRVRLKSGPMRGLEAIFLGPTKPGARVKILLHFLGRLNEVKVDVGTLEPTQRSNKPLLQRTTRGGGRKINTVGRIGQS